MDIEDFVDGLFEADNDLYDAERWERTLQHMVKVGVAGTVGFFVLRIRKYGMPIGISLLSATAIYTMTGLNDIWEWVAVDRDDTAPPKTIVAPIVLEPSDPPVPTPISTMPVPTPPPAPPPPIANPPPPTPIAHPNPPVGPLYGPSVTKVFRVAGRANASTWWWGAPAGHHILEATVISGIASRSFRHDQRKVYVQSVDTITIRVVHAPVIP